LEIESEERQATAMKTVPNDPADPVWDGSGSGDRTMQFPKTVVLVA
jgi:hypothetical protein